MRYWLSAVLLALAASGQAAASELAGRIWAPGEGRFVAPSEVERAVAAARFVLLGEEHTIEAHHALQAHLLRAAARDGQPAVVFEMIPISRQSAIDAWRAAPAPNPADLGPAVSWAERGWPDWQLYMPLAEVALERDLPLLAGGPAREQLRTVARYGLAGLDDARERELGLDRSLPEAGHERLLATLRAVHCGEGHVPAMRMLAAQRLRDAAMAEQLRAAADRHGRAALIAGHGHTRADHGVPQYLDAGADEVVAIAFRGTDGIGAIHEHVAASGGALPYDYVWLTQGRVAKRDCGES